MVLLQGCFIGTVIANAGIVSTNAMVGAVELMIKIYPDGTLTPKLDKLKVGDAVKFKHIEKNVKIQYPFERKTICMVVGGTGAYMRLHLLKASAISLCRELTASVTGITPMIQALHAILGSPGDKTEVKMLYGSRTSDNILGEDFLSMFVSFDLSFPPGIKAAMSSAFSKVAGRFQKEVRVRLCAFA